MVNNSASDIYIVRQSVQHTAICLQTKKGQEIKIESTRLLPYVVRETTGVQPGFQSNMVTCKLSISHFFLI